MSVKPSLIRRKTREALEKCVGVDFTHAQTIKLFEMLEREETIVKCHNCKYRLSYEQYDKHHNYDKYTEHWCERLSVYIDLENGECSFGEARNEQLQRHK